MQYPKRFLAPSGCALTLDGEVLPLDDVVGEGQTAVILRRAPGQHTGGGKDLRHLQGEGKAVCREVMLTEDEGQVEQEGDK